MPDHKHYASVVITPSMHRNRTSFVEVGSGVIDKCAICRNQIGRHQHRKFCLLLRAIACSACKREYNRLRDGLLMPWPKFAPIMRSVIDRSSTEKFKFRRFVSEMLGYCEPCTEIRKVWPSNIAYQSAVNQQHPPPPRMPALR